MNVMHQIDVLPERPYPGLRAFRQDEWPIFFGREEHADEVISRVGRHGLVLIHGASGCGKSSVVRAGVLPTLETDHQIGGRAWRTATMRPSEGLLSKLAEVLEEALPGPVLTQGQAEGAPSAARNWAELVVKGGGLVDHIEEALANSAGGSLCLLVDQFEEIFRWAKERSDAEVRLFVDFLKRVKKPSEGGGFFVILTMRSDYLGACAGYDGFAEFLNERQFLLPKMDEFGLLRAIQEPAELYGGCVEPALASCLLPVVNQQLDGLPVLQHALMRASDHARRRYAEGEAWVVTTEDLAHVGGADGALAKHAEIVLARATRNDPELEEAAEWMFRALTDLDADRRAIRRPCKLEELLEVSGIDRRRTLAVLDEFRATDCVFISPYLPEAIDDATELDISHEALIRQWPRLCRMGVDPETSRPLGWVHREFHDGLIWRSLAVQAQQFAGNRKHLLSVATTEQRLPWFASITKRPGWTKRHVIADRSRDEKAFEQQWKNVSAMMKASGRNLDSERSIVGRLRKSRNLSLVIMFVALSMMALSLAAWNRAANANAQAERIGASLIESLCKTNYPDNKGLFDVCVSAMQSQFNNQLAFTKGQANPTFGTGVTKMPVKSSSDQRSTGER